MWWIEWLAAALTMLAVFLYARGNHQFGNPVQMVACLCWIFMASEQGWQSVYVLNVVLLFLAGIGCVRHMITLQEEKR